MQRNLNSDEEKFIGMLEQAQVRASAKWPAVSEHFAADPRFTAVPQANRFVLFRSYIRMQQDMLALKLDDSEMEYMVRPVSTLPVFQQLPPLLQEGVHQRPRQTRCSVVSQIVHACPSLVSASLLVHGSPSFAVHCYLPSNIESSTFRINSLSASGVLLPHGAGSVLIVNTSCQVKAVDRRVFNFGMHAEASGTTCHQLAGVLGIHSEGMAT